ncbi:MAG: DUF4147 domain-containing protein [Thermoplasmata archaeon]
MTLATDARLIFQAGVTAVDPGRAVGRHLRVSDRGVWVDHRRFAAEGRNFVHVVAVGKAAAAMADAAAHRLGSRLAGGVVVLRQEDPRPRGEWVLRFGTHPLPSGASERAARSVIQYVEDLPADSLLLVLLSGGGSAMFEAPAKGLSMREIRTTYAALLACGAPIQSINAVRRHLSAVKGGLLAAAAAPRRVVTLAISDVVGDTPYDIASGPTVADPTTFADALTVARRWSVTRRLPPRVIEHLRAGASGRLSETPKPTDPIFRRTSFHLVATNRLALKACGAEARRRGYVVRTVSSTVTGDTQRVARDLTRRFGRGVRPNGPRERAMAWLSGGETTVILGSHHGRGGRNQEFALTAAQVCDHWASVAVLSAGTDGIDGPTDAAGGLVTGVSASLARRRGVDLFQALQRHAAYPALYRMGALLRTGPTGTNVMDLHIFLAGRLSRRVPQGGAASTRR